jgi:HD superfamily phosphohydrolase
MVYHGAEHSRFGHALGAMHTVDKALQKIKKNSEVYDIPIDLEEEDFKLARFAALLHDVGHLPFSHALDEIIPIHHEEYSAAIVEKVFADIIDKSGINVKDVKDLILGHGPLDKPFLISLINSQLDVDKFDYLLRDSHYAGVKYGIFDLDRILDSLLVIEEELVILDGGYYAAEQLILARYHMFEQLYYHHTKRAFENMVRIVAKHLLDNDKMNYPSIEQLDDNPQLRLFTNYNDSFFLSHVQNYSGDESIRRIVRLITDRMPFKLVVDSRDIWRKMPGGEEEHPSVGKGFFRALRNDIKNNLNNMRINHAEIIFDEFRNVPYKLRPYTRLGESSDGPDAIFIYNHKIDSKKPIETLSVTVKELATSPLSTERIYVDRNKHTSLHNFLKSKYPEYL